MTLAWGQTPIIDLRRATSRALDTSYDERSTTAKSFKFRGSGFPKFSAPTSGEIMRRIPKSFEVQERARGPLSPCWVWWGSDFTRHRDSQNVSFLSVCHTFERHSFCVRFWHEAVCIETVLILLDRGRFAVVQVHSTFSARCQLATSQNDKIWKPVKFGDFFTAKMQQNKLI